MAFFRSDNNAGLCPEASAALVDVARGHAVGYGDDPETARATALLRQLFGDDTVVAFVATGTAANTLAVASLTEPWQRVLCHAASHWYDDESTAPERITLCRSTPVHPQPTSEDPSRLTPDDLAPHFGGPPRGVHQPAPGVLTLTNATEFGTVYSPDQLRAVVTTARSHGYHTHVDGARFANAVARHMAETSASAAAACRALTVDAGISALSLGGTKAGLAYGEALLLFPQVCAAATRAAERLPYLRKSTGHLLSKHRFISGPFAAVLAGDAWLRHAAHANAMATRLATGLTQRGCPPRFACHANAVFVALGSGQDTYLQSCGHTYYAFATPRGLCARLMCSFATTADEVDEFLRDYEVVARL